MANTKGTSKGNHGDEFRQHASELGHNVQELGKATKNLANDTVDYLRENAGDYVKQGKEKAHQLEETLETKIKESPIKALLIALGVGWLLGILMRRR